MQKEQIGLTLIVFILIAIGIVMIYSTSAIYAAEKFDDSYFFLKRQLFWLTLGIFVFLGITKIPYTVLREYKWIILGLSLLLLVAVFIPYIGKTAGGAQRWIRVASFTFQPSEFAKIALIIFLADYLTLRQRKLTHFFKGFLPCLLVLGLFLGLIVLQPDLGAVILLGAVAFILFFVSGIRMVHLLTLFLISLPVLYHFIFKVTFRRNRMLAFMNPWQDPEGTGFQIIQSFIALGSGGVTGMGLGGSRQKLFYLPEAHTDFIFSIVGEELGLVGALSIVALFAGMIFLGFRIALKAQDLFGRLLALGLISILGLQALINIGVVTGALPTKGLALPFISYGGSNLIISLMMVGILINIAKFGGKRKKSHAATRSFDLTPHI